MVDQQEGLDEYEPTAGEMARVGERHFKTGLRHFNARNYEEAQKQFRIAAENGDKAAQTYLGGMYYAGQGVPRNYEEALRWFTEAAKQGEASAQYNLAKMYSRGRGVPENAAEAKKWYAKAADQGLEEALHCLRAIQDFGSTDVLLEKRTPKASVDTSADQQNEYVEAIAGEELPPLSGRERRGAKTGDGLFSMPQDKEKKGGNKKNIIFIAVGCCLVGLVVFSVYFVVKTFFGGNSSDVFVSHNGIRFDMGRKQVEALGFVCRSETPTDRVWYTARCTHSSMTGMVFGVPTRDYHVALGTMGTVDMINMSIAEANMTIYSELPDRIERIFPKKNASEQNDTDRIEEWRNKNNDGVVLTLIESSSQIINSSLSISFRSSRLNAIADAEAEDN